MNNRQAVLQSYALLLVRLVVGSVFLLHGAQKVFGLFGGPGLDGFGSYIASLGLPVTLGHLAAIFELVAGIMLVFGIATELGALMTIPVMKVAIYLVHWSNGYFIQNQGYEYALNLLLLAAAIIIGGPGAHALWDPFAKWRK
ncbi:hypothetical protein Noda2021_10230 [Candidatus Dependentiae bacterium Noda2021]|nr:hypothetical protein Noda2021_10230 [Candidatus Dependentiae bacterium Noda2021]